MRQWLQDYSQRETDQAITADRSMTDGASCISVDSPVIDVE